MLVRGVLVRVCGSATDVVAGCHLEHGSGMWFDVQAGPEAEACALIEVEVPQGSCQLQRTLELTLSTAILSIESWHATSLFRQRIPAR